MVASVKEIQKSIRADAEAMIKEREAAALPIVQSLEKVEAAKAKVAELEQLANQAVATAMDTMPASDLAKLTGIDARVLKRMAKESALIDVTDKNGIG